ncbi:hypothetical protein SK128_026157 [Halocaridina rubra]|uniref:Spaetzle domain-containing protein n=1 Tax=Halocaridina rubra TaxID=373956 RepID=A0AAN8WQU7_HALRR
MTGVDNSGITINGSDHTTGLFTQDCRHAKKTLTPTEEISPTTRFGGFRETPVCGAQEELIFPQRAKTPKNDWVFVVNQEDVKQALRVEKCTREGNACNIGVPTNDVETVCRQKYVYRRMLILGSNNIQPEEVLMPSCCVCYSSVLPFPPVKTHFARRGFDSKISENVNFEVQSFGHLATVDS